MKLRLLAGLVCAGLLGLATTGVAIAHAALVESDPPDGGTIETTPYTLTATFDEELDPDSSSIVVRDAEGTEVARGGVSEDDATVMTVNLSELEPGDYRARWTAVTPDDQAVTRAVIAFTVAPPASPSPSPTPTAAPTGTAPATGPPTATPGASPTASPSPVASAPPVDGQPATTGNDVLLALLLAAAAVGAILIYLFARSRR